MRRREAVKALGAGALGIGAGYGVAPPALERFRRELARGYQYRFFTSPELLETMRLVADIIIPRDERSGGATDAGAVEYADFVLSEGAERTREIWRDGFAWLDSECWQRFCRRRFVECSEEERTAVLDDIAYPRRARPEFRQAVDWFNRVRDLVGSGFFSSQTGVEDIRYIGGVFVLDWEGAPPEALRELGASYEVWDRRYRGGGRR